MYKGYNPSSNWYPEITDKSHLQTQRRCFFSTTGPHKTYGTKTVSLSTRENIARCPGTPSLKKQTASWLEGDPFGTKGLFSDPVIRCYMGRVFVAPFFGLRLSADTPPKHIQLQKNLEVFVQVHFLWSCF